MLIAAAAVLIATLAATGLVLKFLHRHAIFDHPNKRSSHTGLVPRGGGLAVVSVLIVAWAVVTAPENRIEVGTVLLAALLLAGVSWIDDLRSLPPWIRLLAQAAAVLPALVWLGPKGPVFHGLVPGPLDLALSGLVWLWFINLFNFMDGIDGITGVETASIGAGIALIASRGLGFGLDPTLAATVSAAAIGFLWWNWHPAKIFLGDVGSVPLGFLLGWLLLNLASDGYWAAALILPLYYLADATITLLRRAARRERVWKAHREHFYQHAVQNGRSHATVSIGVGVCNAALLGLAMLSLAWPWVALFAAVAVVCVFLFWLSR
ncbi:MAG: glycosyl transferase [Alphaproteobacteria bacterium]|nr:glycosyl transferase [Alphaproteobacteria bacterium]